MLIKICIDIWRDVFDFLLPSDRRQLAQKFSDVGDREFSDICQKWLHEWTKNVRIGSLKIIQRSGTFDVSQQSGSAILRVWSGDMENVPFAVAELPANIQDFDRVDISYLDATVLNFLRRMQPLFHNVEMRIVLCYNVDNILGLLLPFLGDGGIETLVVRCHYDQPSGPPTPLLIFMRDRFSAQFFAIKRLQLNVVSLYGVLELLLKWLHTPLTDGQHRVLKLLASDGAVKLVEPIRQQFINATISVNFFVYFWLLPEHSFEAIQESTTQNAGTNEQLLFRLKPPNALFIGRCQSGLDGQKWMEEMEREYNGYCFAERGSQGARRIISLNDPTLGSFEEENSEERQDEAEEKFDQPGPSEKPKMS